MAEPAETRAPEPWHCCAVCFVAREDHDPATFVEDAPEGGFTGPLSEHELEALVLRFGPAEIPPCRVCGAELKVTAAGRGPTKYACGSPEAEWLVPEDQGGGFHGPRYEHWCASQYEQVRHGDRRVIRLVEEMRALRAQSV